MTIEYRLFKEQDISELSILYIDSWLRTYKNIIPDGFLETLNYDMAEKKWIKFLKEEKDSFAYVAIDKTNDKEVICGLSICKRDDELEYSGLLYSLHVQNGYKGKGIGKNLIKVSAKHFKDHLNLNSLLLWVVDGNANALAVYTKLGAKVLKHQIEVYYSNIETHETCLIWENTDQLLN
ncbi:hypothetical protein DICPUDRAFT_83983 [Dictyostelium purpureum]|uniref:N-acetyltransferase domain-containing protein n=1 Tax=Dictyostelium purpureum TaxID=5786 RepID=F1A186_DICPU|nr:uncharacterized protein DICPUDRAFT_83983 [Dictyostelium purpureum]EGC30047.1 hypothetical protein DICPUDRAFT_83983 [Dictyostelium purpureum]|eukprot:XP_003293434.1 hypothetical protein DICPUDRAFT_83983 [Dictyostelium purpureum]